EHRAREGMDRPAGERGQVGDRRVGGEMPVARVPGLERHVLAFTGLDDRLEVGVPAVVSRPGLPGQRLPAVDRDGLRHGVLLILSVHSRAHPRRYAGWRPGTRAGAARPTVSTRP